MTQDRPWSCKADLLHHASHSASFRRPVSAALVRDDARTRRRNPVTQSGGPRGDRSGDQRGGRGRSAVESDQGGRRRPCTREGDRRGGGDLPGRRRLVEAGVQAGRNDAGSRGGDLHGSAVRAAAAEAARGGTALATGRYGPGRPARRRGGAADLLRGSPAAASRVWTSLSGSLDMVRRAPQPKDRKTVECGPAPFRRLSRRSIRV